LKDVTVMLLTNEFVVHRPLDETWAVLTDLERIAPCMPGAQLTSVQGDEYHGKVKVKVGPMTAQFSGVATFKELDAAAHRAVIDARGRDATGKGRASALVTAVLVADGDTTKVTVETDLTIAGPLAQMGRGTIGDISTRLLTQFVTNLEAQLAATPPTATTAPAATTAPTRAAPAAPADSAAPTASVAPTTSVAPAASAASAATIAPADSTAPTTLTTSAAPAAPTTSAAPTAPTTSAAPTASTTSAAPAATAATASAPVEETSADSSDPAEQVAVVAAIVPTPNVPDASGATTAPADHAAAQTAAPIRIIDGPEAEPVNLLETAGTTNIIKIAVPVIVLIAAIVALIIWLT
jgi:carbon monoxide dehydrogenase subunit G